MMLFFVSDFLDMAGMCSQHSTATGEGSSFCWPTPLSVKDGGSVGASNFIVLLQMGS